MEKVRPGERAEVGSKPWVMRQRGGRGGQTDWQEAYNLTWPQWRYEWEIRQWIFLKSTNGCGSLGEVSSPSP